MSARDAFLSWQKLRELCFARDNYTCVWCGEFDGVTLHLDHLYPSSKGGTNDPENLVTSCDRCNLGKHARVIPDTWIPVATCFCCNVRSHPKGKALMLPDGPAWLCDSCADYERERRDAEDHEWAEAGPWDDLSLEQYAWDLVEFADDPEILAAKYPHMEMEAA